MSHVIVLGSGTSSGVPVLGKRYPSSFTSNPKNWRTRPSVIFSGPSGNVLVDCTPDMRSQLLREGIFELAGVVVTHTHADHIMGMDDLRAFCIQRGGAIPVYTLPEHMPDIRRVFSYAFREFPEGIEVPRFDLHDAPPVLEMAGLSLRLGTVLHGQIPVISIRAGDFAYVTDVKTIPKESEWLMEGLETLILGAVRLRPHANHMNLDEALATIERFRPKQTYLTHLSDDFDHERTNEELPPGVELAYDGLKIEL